METTVLLDGGAFFEGPRWRDGKLWCSDMHGRQVLSVDQSGSIDIVTLVPNRPSGLGWLPSGEMLVVSMTDRQLLRYEGGALVAHADLSSLAQHECNDMVVDRNGRAYVGHFGFDHFAHAPSAPASIIAVDPDGSRRIVADDLMFPNGTVITSGGDTLIVAESYAWRLTAFDIAADGSLGHRRTWAKLGMAPDGICLDAEGCVWVASPTGRAVVRVREGGEITERVELGRKGIACMLGGLDRRTLFVLTSETTQPSKALKLRSARIETVRVDVPGDGLP